MELWLISDLNQLFREKEPWIGSIEHFASINPYKSNNQSMGLRAKRVVPDSLAAKCCTWVLVEEFGTKLSSYDVILNITVFDLKQTTKAQDWELNGFNKAWGIIENDG